MGRVSGGAGRQRTTAPGAVALGRQPGAANAGDDQAQRILAEVQRMGLQPATPVTQVLRGVLGERNGNEARRAANILSNMVNDGSLPFRMYVAAQFSGIEFRGIGARVDQTLDAIHNVLTRTENGMGFRFVRNGIYPNDTKPILRSDSDSAYYRGPNNQQFELSFERGGSAFLRGR